MRLCSRLPLLRISRVCVFVCMCMCVRVGGGVGFFFGGYYACARIAAAGARAARVPDGSGSDDELLSGHAHSLWKFGCGPAVAIVSLK